MTFQYETTAHTFMFTENAKHFKKKPVSIYELYIINPKGIPWRSYICTSMT